MGINKQVEHGNKQTKSQAWISKHKVYLIDLNKYPVFVHQVLFLRNEVVTAITVRFILKLFR